MKKRIQWVDIAKGIAILAVVIGHTLGPYSGHFVGSFIFAFHMPIFFILSGYLYHQRPWRQEFQRGVINLLLPYFTTGLIVIGVSWIATRLPRNLVIWPYFPSVRRGALAVLYGAGSEVFNPWKWQIAPIGAIWFLLCLFLAMQLFNGTMVVTRRSRHATLVQLVMVIGYAVVGGCLGRIAYLSWALNAALLAQVFLYAGYLFKKLDGLERVSAPWYLLLAFLWLVSALQGYFAMTVPVSPNLIISVIGGIAGSLCVIRVSDQLTKFQGTRMINLLERYGRLSLVVLCFHLIDLNVIGIEGWLFDHALPVVGPLIATVTGITYRIVFVTLWMFLIPKIPGLRMSFLPRKYLVFKAR